MPYFMDVDPHGLKASREALAAALDHRFVSFRVCHPNGRYVTHDEIDSSVSGWGGSSICQTSCVDEALDVAESIERSYRDAGLETTMLIIIDNANHRLIAATIEEMLHAGHGTAEFRLRWRGRRAQTRDRRQISEVSSARPDP